MAISNPPERIDDAHAHSADSRKESADQSDQQSGREAERQNHRRQNKCWQHSVQSRAQSGYREESKTESEQAPNRGDDKRFGKHKEEDPAIAEADCFQNRKLAGALTH